MGFFPRTGSTAASAPRAATQSAGGGTLIVSPEQLEEALRSGNISAAGEAVTPERALRVAAVYGCVRLRCTGPATLPLDIKRRVDERTRADASDHFAYRLFRRRPNQWQKPHQFKRMMQAHVLLRGNAYALKVPGVRGTQALIPLHPGRVQTKQLDDLSIVHDWTRKDGKKIRLRQEEVFHLFGLTLDGITGVTPITYARETIGTSLAMGQYAGKVLGRGARVSGSLQTDNQLSETAYDRLKESTEEFRAGGDREGDFMILEEGLKYERISLSLADLEWIDAQKLSWAEIAMFYGVPPHMLGMTEKSTSWGTGIEEQRQGFLDFTAEDDFTMWEEGINADLIAEPDVYARFNRRAFVRGNIKARWAAYVNALQWGVYSPNKVLELEDENPREGGDIFYPPPNTAGDASAQSKDDDDEDDAAANRQR
ncbi:phage portal protein [Stakelama tenebrarum]|uniref:Phage portal protein n=1 Tax=Stakelama tenebrarum TaxID=2711215 RepID=A0A6G6Y5B8_9SPHN|nr:phage portal protein [Sphingosinithalassobacter tenebrarum]QIG80100.1 phage portal protein [Sphingosinithalassobacter tenebrarum]